MRVGIDFDRVLFDTDRFNSYREEATGLYHVEADVYDEHGNYSAEKHAEACGVDVEDVYEKMNELEQFLYDDIEVLEQLEEHELVIVTRGQKRFQKHKLEESGALKFIENYEIIESGPKNADIDLLIDDREKEIDEVDVPGFIFDREVHGAEDIVDFVRAEEVFKRYDVRGSHPEQIDENFAREFGKALGTFVLENGGEKIVASRDNKESSEGLKDMLVNGVLSTGVDVIDAGAGPTDYAAFAGVEENSHSVQVTSSHLSLGTNGFKMMYPEGNGFVNEDLARLKQIFRRKSFWSGEGERIEADYREDYIEKALEYVDDLHDLSKGKIVYESMGGAGSVFVPELMRRAGFEIIDLSEEYDSPHIDPPDPSPENLEHVEEEVEETGAKMGLATDMDADRVALYFDGEWVDGNTLFALFAQLVQPERIVASIDTSRSVEESFNGEISYTRVGDPFVIDETLEIDASLSGEPNGHYCFTDFVPYNSGGLAALILAGTELEEGLQKVPEFHNLRETVEVENKDSEMQRVVRKAEELFDVISTKDGVCYNSGEARVLIRPSGSSQKIRAIADSRSEDAAREALDEAVEIIENA